MPRIYREFAAICRKLELHYREVQDVEFTIERGKLWMLQTRDAKRSAIHDRLVAEGAYFKDVSGWEGADWYAGRGQTPDPGPLSFGRMRWFDTWRAEHQAAREGVILMDMSFMAKFRVEGRDAGALLNQISANDVDGEAGRITYTQWLNEGGTLEADLTVTKLGERDYFVVASDTAHRHVETHMRRVFEQGHAFCADVTSAYAQINIQGPRSRALMQAVTDADLSNDAFPFRAAREIAIGFARVLCVRITYLGELGYELYVPTEQAVHVYDRLAQAGAPMGLRHAGLKALASLRMEKGYRDYGHDIDNTDSVLEAGLGFAVDLKKPGGFIGRDADITEENIQSRIRGLTLMALSNKFGHMLLTTGNKSEMSVGYATIYGDMAGGYNPLKDAYKMTVFAISKWRNRHKPRFALGRDGPVIPDNIINKPPSAELRPDQKDSDSLPDYPILDKMLHALVEEERSVDEVVALGFDRDAVTRIERLLYLAEYKRRQAPPGVKLGTRNFGRDRRYPITNAFRSGG
jgi:NAD+ synthetase